MRPDPAYIETEKEIARIEARLAKEYKKAEEDVEKKLQAYYKAFEVKDKKWREWVRDGKKTAAEYKQWRIGQLAVGERWQAMKRAVAEDYAHVNQIARDIVSGKAPTVYAENFNYGTYEVEHAARMNTSFTLYSKDAVARVARDNPKMLPDPGRRTAERILHGLDVKYNEERLQSVVMQAIIQGESIPKIAKRLAEEVGESDHKAAIRNARTAMTGAQNAGRIDAYNRANEMGIKTEKCWVATWDNRTRHAHRELDGQTIPVNEPFENEFGEIMYPGDPNAEGANVWNCRCTLISQISGYEIDTTAYREDNLGDMTYEEWKEGHGVSRSITHGEEVGEAIRMAHYANYRRQ